MSNFMQVTFKSISVNSKFNCCGNIHLNYEYPKEVESIKIDEETAEEISTGTRFFMLPNDEISILKIKPEVSMKTKSMERDAVYLPEHYVVKEEPFYQGPGNHSVTSLESLCSDFTEYVHQQQIIKQQLFLKLEELLKHNAKANSGSTISEKDVENKADEIQKNIHKQIEIAVELNPKTKSTYQDFTNVFIFRYLALLELKLESK